MQNCQPRCQGSLCTCDSAPERAIAPSGGQISVISRASDCRFGGSREPSDFCNRLLGSKLFAPLRTWQQVFRISITFQNTFSLNRLSCSVADLFWHLGWRNCRPIRGEVGCVDGHSPLIWPGGERTGRARLSRDSPASRRGTRQLVYFTSRLPQPASDDLTSLSGRGYGFAIGPCETRISG